MKSKKPRLPMNAVAVALRRKAAAKELLDRGEAANFHDAVARVRAAEERRRRG